MNTLKGGISFRNNHTHKGAQIVSEINSPMLDLKDIDFVPDTVLCCCGGGGLISGLSIALKSYWDNLNIHPVEPEFWDDTKISLKEKKRHKIIKKKRCYYSAQT